MKKTIQIIVLAVLCLNFSSKAQDNPSTVTALKIGDKVPDITINDIINYKSGDGKAATTAKISDFKGKLLILDFWATWCSPCIAMIPKMDSLQKEFAGRVQFLPVAYQSQMDVQLLLDKLQKQQRKIYDLPGVVNDKFLSKLFPHTTLPHFVWIDPKGIVSAITDQGAINNININKLLSHIKIDAPTKQEAPLIDYDRTQPLFTHKIDAFDSTVVFHSELTRCIEGLRGGYHYDIYARGKSRRITVRNAPLMLLFSYAFSGQNKTFGEHKILFNVKDTTALTSSKTGAEYHRWLFNNHGYCYELIVPPTMAENIFSIMQSDLSRLFPQYEAKLKLINRDCWVLTRTTTNDKIKSGGGTPNVRTDRFGFHMTNATLDYFIVQMDSFYLSNSPYPVINGSGYTGKADLTIDANLGSIDSINKALEKYELKFVLKKAPVEMLVISDNNSQ